jgi:DNA-binding MarR family transcriptional regulator
MSLQDELKMSQSFASSKLEALLSVARTHAILDGIQAKLFTRFGTTSTQFNILRILAGHKSPEGMSCSEISSRMITNDSDITRLLDKLERSELIVRVRSTHDRRKVLTQISENGRTLIAQIAPELDQSHQQCLGHMQPEQLTTLIELLEQVRAPHR